MKWIGSALVVCATVLSVAAEPPRPPAEPAKIKLLVVPQPVQAGGEAQLTVELEPIAGVKINRYPKVKVSVPEQEGLLRGAEVSVGNDAPPPPDKMSSNYFDKVEPLELKLALDGAAPRGRRELDGKVTYYYCMPANGFCAPKRVPVKIPLSVD